MADNDTDQSSGVPMLAPDGTVRQVPHELAPSALRSGGQIVARLQAPTGDLHWVPYGQIHDAITKGGGKMVDSSVIPDASTAPQSGNDKGFLSGLWDSTVGGLTNFGKSMSHYYEHHEDPTKMSGGQIASGLSQQLLLGPAKILKDAAIDPQHPIHQLVKGLVDSHIDTGKRAVQKFQDSIAAAKNGNFDEAERSFSEAQGLGLATVVPIVGPAAAKAGEDIGAGQTGYGAGEATGLIGSVAIPEAIRSGAKALKPTTATIAGESIPVRASQESGLAGAAEKISADKPLQRFDIERTQPAAKRAISNVATDIKSAAGERVPAMDAESALKKLRNAPTKAMDLADAAEKVRDFARPVFDKLDELTKDDPQTFSELQKQERSAYRRDDFEAAQKAREAQEAVLDRYADQFKANDLKGARSLWRQASALDDVHDALNGKTVVGPTPIKFRVKGAPDPGYIYGKNFAKQVQALKTDGTLAQAGLAAQHIQALQDLATLLEKSGAVQQADLVSKAVKAVKITAGGPGTLGAGYFASRLIGRILTDPTAATTLLELMRSAAPTLSGTSVVASGTDELER